VLRIILAVCLLVTIINSSHSQNIKSKEGKHSSYNSDIVYTIRMRVLPDSLLVRAEMEIQYTNDSPDTLSDIYFQLGLNAFQSGSYMDKRLLQVEDSALFKLPDSQRGYCKIDSILYLGEPLKDSQLVYDNTILRVKLPQPIPPQKKGFFLIAFESRLPRQKSSKSLFLEFNRWYPRICPFYKGQWYRHQYLGWGQYDGAYANYNIALKIDSSYRIYFPGKMLNEKERLGWITGIKKDSIYCDIIPSLTKPNNIPSTATSIKDTSYYYMEAKQMTDFPFVVSKYHKLDRAFLNDVTIDVYYDKTKLNWQRFVAANARQLLKEMEKKLGAFPYRNLIIVSGNNVSTDNNRQPLIVLSNKVKDKQQLIATLAVKIASCWFSPTLSKTNGVNQFFSEGLLYYTALRVICDLYPNDGYKMMRKYEKRIKKKSDFYKLYKKDKKFLNPYKRAVKINEPFIADDITLLGKYLSYQYREYPAELYMLRFVIGENDLWQAIHEFVNRYQYEFTTENDFENIINETTNQKDNWFFRQWHRKNNDYDFAIYDVKVKKINDSDNYQIMYRLQNDGSIIMPVEMGFVTNKRDTIFDTLSYFDFADSTKIWSFSKTIIERPTAIVLDPHHYLWDKNRFNNYYFEYPIRYRYEEPANLFLGFRKF